MKKITVIVLTLVSITLTSIAAKADDPSSIIILARKSAINFYNVLVGPNVEVQPYRKSLYLNQSGAKLFCDIRSETCILEGGSFIPTKYLFLELKEAAAETLTKNIAKNNVDLIEGDDWDRVILRCRKDPKNGSFCRIDFFEGGYAHDDGVGSLEDKLEFLVLDPCPF